MLPVHASVAQAKDVTKFRGTTRDISREGVAIEMPEDRYTMETTRTIVSTVQDLELVLELPRTGETVIARGH